MNHIMNTISNPYFFFFNLILMAVGNGNPLQYSCLENPMDRGAWWATVDGVAKSQTQLSMHMVVRT